MHCGKVFLNNKCEFCQNMFPAIRKSKLYIPRSNSSEPGLVLDEGGRLLLIKCLCPPRIRILKLNPQYDSIGRWGLGRCLGREGEALMNWISALIKETLESSLTPSTA